MNTLIPYTMNPNSKSAHVNPHIVPTDVGFGWVVDLGAGALDGTRDVDAVEASQLRPGGLCRVRPGVAAAD